jgi:hypothetical protein
MMKRHEKWIALLVVFTFAWLLQVSTMPVAAADSSEPAGVASAEQGPNFYEAAKPKPAPAPKKSILPYVLIGVGVVAVAAVLFLVVLKTKYDLRGTWSLTRSSEFTWITNPRNFIFAGESRESGTLSITVASDTGTWTVDGKTVSFTLTKDANDFLWTFTGTFTDKANLTGTVNYHDASHDINGTWTAIRINAE